MQHWEELGAKEQQHCSLASGCGLLCCRFACAGGCHCCTLAPRVAAVREGQTDVRMASWDVFELRLAEASRRLGLRRCSSPAVARRAGQRKSVNSKACVATISEASERSTAEDTPCLGGHTSCPPHGRIGGPDQSTGAFR